MSIGPRGELISPDRRAMLQILQRLGFTIQDQCPFWIIRNYDSDGWYTEKKVKTQGLTWRLVRDLLEREHPSLNEHLTLSFFEWLNNELS